MDAATTANASASTKCYGAVLERAEDSGRKFDAWVVTEDFAKVMAAPDGSS